VCTTSKAVSAFPDRRRPKLEMRHRCFGSENLSRESMSKTDNIFLVKIRYKSTQKY